MEYKKLGSGKYLSLYKKGTWEFCQRPFSDVAVGILAFTPKNEILLVEQFRIPVGKRVIELPAGLVGDCVANENSITAAHRELIEETGYKAKSLIPLLNSPTSAGMTSEITQIILAEELEQISSGGGVDGEEIILHKIPKSDCLNWLQEKEKTGLLIDFKIYAALLAADHYFSQKSK